jgi:hypothetical protein
MSGLVRATLSQPLIRQSAADFSHGEMSGRPGWGGMRRVHERSFEDLAHGTWCTDIKRWIACI